MTAEWTRFCALCGQCQFCMHEWERVCYDAADRLHVWNSQEKHTHVTPESLELVHSLNEERRQLVEQARSQRMRKQKTED